MLDKRSVSLSHSPSHQLSLNTNCVWSRGSDGEFLLCYMSGIENVVVSLDVGAGN